MTLGESLSLPGLSSPLPQALDTGVTKTPKLCSPEALSPQPLGAGTQDSERQPLSGWDPRNLPCVACDLISGPPFPGRVWGWVGGLGGHIPESVLKLSPWGGITLSFPQCLLSHLTPQRVQQGQKGRGCFRASGGYMGKNISVCTARTYKWCAPVLSRG